VEVVIHPPAEEEADEAADAGRVWNSTSSSRFEGRREQTDNGTWCSARCPHSSSPRFALPSEVGEMLIWRDSASSRQGSIDAQILLWHDVDCHQ